MDGLKKKNDDCGLYINIYDIHLSTIFQHNTQSYIYMTYIHLFFNLQNQLNRKIKMKEYLINHNLYKIIIGRCHFAGSLCRQEGRRRS